MLPQTIYTASVNPTRRAKAVHILPKLSPPSPMASDDEDYQPPSTPPSPTTKRGRKPGTMSRPAREAQRKLNHSIIEKARRTKINDALATLRQLVPDNFGVNDGLDKDEVCDVDAEYQPKAGKGKKAEKEKEFKLEILVRTVGYMQHLLDRVKELENDNTQRKRKVADEDESSRKKPRRDSLHGQTNHHLPSISSWLPNVINPPPQSPQLFSQLPTPPSSSAFAPVSQLFQPPPALVT